MDISLFSHLYTKTFQYIMPIYCMTSLFSSPVLRKETPMSPDLIQFWMECSVSVSKLDIYLYNY